MHGITDAEVRSCPSPGDALRDFTRWLRELGDDIVLLAHNASFDLEIVSYEAARAGVAVPGCLCFDTLTLARRTLPGLPAYSLEALCRGLSLPQGRFHRAGADSRITLDLFAYCVRQALGDELPASTVASALELLGDPRHFRPWGTLAPSQEQLARSLRSAIEKRAEVSLELRRGGSTTATRMARPLAVYPAPEGAAAAGYLDVHGDTEEGVELIPLDSIVAATPAAGGQGMLFGGDVL